MYVNQEEAEMLVVYVYIIEALVRLIILFIISFSGLL